MPRVPFLLAPSTGSASFMVTFNSREEEFLQKNEVCRLASVGKEHTPHVVPVCYVYSKGILYIASDYGTRKLANLRRNSQVGLVVDSYRPNKAVVVQGKAEILEKGPEFRSSYKLLYDRFDWVRRDPWKEGEAPILKVVPFAKVSWGLGR